MGMTVDEFLSRVSSAELSGWLAFEETYGIPDGYFVAGLVAQAIHAANGQAVPVSDLIPYFADSTPLPPDDDAAIAAETEANMKFMAALRVRQESSRN